MFVSQKKQFHGDSLHYCLSLGNAQGLSTTWNGFEEALKRHFIPPNYKRFVMNELKKCKQKGSATEYFQDFRSLILDLPDLFERQKMYKAFDRLKATLKVQLCRDLEIIFNEAS